MGGWWRWALVNADGKAPAGWSVCLPLFIFPCTIKSGSSRLAPAHMGDPGKRAIKQLWFGINVADKASNQKMLYCATSNNLCFCTTWRNGEAQKSHFSLKCCRPILVPGQNSTSRCLISSIFFTHDSYSCCCMML